MRPRNMNRLASFVAVALLAALVVPAVAQDDEAKKDDAAKKADVNGTWKWSFTTQGGETREQSAKLKQEGEKITGTVTGRQGNETEIKDGKLDKDGKLTFSVVREFNGNEMTQKFEGKVDGDTIKGKVVTTRGDQTREREWEAKRAKAEDSEKKES